MSRLLSTKCVANSIITGIVNSVIMLLHAVSDTDNATSPLAIMEKMLDELPPGEQAMRHDADKKQRFELEDMS